MLEKYHIYSNLPKRVNTATNVIRILNILNISQINNKETKKTSKRKVDCTILKSNFILTKKCLIGKVNVLTSNFISTIKKSERTSVVIILLYIEFFIKKRYCAVLRFIHSAIEIKLSAEVRYGRWIHIVMDEMHENCQQAKFHVYIGMNEM